MPDEKQVSVAAMRIFAAQQRKLKERLETRSHATTDGGYDDGDQKQRKDRAAYLDAHHKAVEANVPPPFPTPLVAAALRAADVVVPELLEDRVLRIAELYHLGKHASQIAEETGYPLQEVKGQLAHLHRLRKAGMENSPDLGKALVQRELEVMDVTVDMVRTDLELLAALERELLLDHQDKLNAIAQNSPYAYKKGMNSLKVDAYFRGRDSLGKQLDRVAQLQGLLTAQSPLLQQNNTVLNFGNDALNALANQIMQSTGNVPAEITTAVHENDLVPDPNHPADAHTVPRPTQPVIDVEAS